MDILLANDEIKKIDPRLLFEENKDGTMSLMSKNAKIKNAIPIKQSFSTDNKSSLHLRLDEVDELLHFNFRYSDIAAIERFMMTLYKEGE